MILQANYLAIHDRRSMSLGSARFTEETKGKTASPGFPRKNAASSGALGRNRTCDQEIRRLLLYPLSYEGECAWFGGFSILHKATRHLVWWK